MYFSKYANYSTQQQIMECLHFFKCEMIDAYLIHCRIKPTMIWGPPVDLKLYNGWPVYNGNNSAISWYCQPQSPCGNVMPKIPENPDYYFLVKFSNR